MKGEIYIINRNKVAYLQMEGIFQERIEKVEKSGKYAYVFLKTDVVMETLKEYENDERLKRYNSIFKNIIQEINRLKESEK